MSKHQVDCEVCGERYDLVVGESVTPETKSGVLADRRPPHLNYKNFSLRFFCSPECGEKLRADILAA